MHWLHLSEISIHTHVADRGCERGFGSKIVSKGSLIYLKNIGGEIQKIVEERKEAFKSYLRVKILEENVREANCCPTLAEGQNNYLENDISMKERDKHTYTFTRIWR
ncbi:hypothetical protein Nepgr_024755 [Nepenthes gracilis]|uniref:Uncharacterized protein n=1 Tax=Nepenthes gracilis TaxID=150966 RepID=A0AAD3T542_NEPGR|nr:hypothetical protein Nepgr_024755 [Nepenthes gracilis]